MKTKWISINTKMPILNEIIYYKGNLGGREAIYIGGDNVLLKNGRSDRLDEWVPKHSGLSTFNILHNDGLTNIEAKGIVDDGLFTTEYTHEGMCYGAVIPLSRIK
jgi:hypothetical protein